MIFKCCLMDWCFNDMEKFNSNRFLLPLLILIVINFFIWCVFLLIISMVVDVYCIVYFLWLNLVVHCFGVERPNTCSLEPSLDFFLVRDWFMAWSTHPTKVILSNSMILFLDIIASLTFLNVVLNWNKTHLMNVKHVMYETVK